MWWIWLVDPASACGGIFCNSVEPVEQTAERILFQEERPGQWTTFVEVQFQGAPTAPMCPTCTW